MEEYLSPAFYMIPAIDNTSENVIYINKGHITDNLSLFTTFAHEGYPGHLYQNVYYASLHPNPIRCVLNYGGYTEGWATYSEMMSYYFSTLTKEQATIFQRNSSVILGLYALADMGIHYDGLSVTDTVRFFSDYGINDPNAVQSVYKLIIGSTANTITVQTDDGAIDTFRTENAQDLTAGGMEYGDYVCVTFHPSKSKSSNIYTAIKVQDA